MWKKASQKVLKYNIYDFTEAWHAALNHPMLTKYLAAVTFMPYFNLSLAHLKALF